MTLSHGARAQRAITQMVNWATRPETRERMQGAAGVDLTVGDVALLRAIVTAGSTRVSELAELRGVDKSTITPQVRRLEQRGLVEREAGTEDRRAVHLRPSGHGTRACDEMNAAGAAVFDEAMSDWTEEDRNRFTELLLRFTNDLLSTPRSPSVHL